MQEKFSKSAPAEIQRDSCARCSTREKKADINYFGDHHVPQWHKKRLCWKCYVDAHVKAYKKHYYCPYCRRKIASWRGVYSDWGHMQCRGGHIVNVNFLVKPFQIKSRATFSDREPRTHIGSREIPTKKSKEISEVYGFMNAGKNKDIFSYLDDEKGKKSGR